MGMAKRRLGRTGIDVSEIGFGAWGLGKAQRIGADDDTSSQALRRALDLGLTFIDTALAYGEGHSERLVGEAVRERDEWIVVATKIPPKNLQWPAPAGLDPEETFPARWVRRCTEKSLENLGLERIDVQQFHVWSDEWVGRGTWLDEIEKLKSEGLIGAFGVSINDHQPSNALRLIESGVVDTVQVIHNIFDQSPEDELFDACRQHDVGVIVRVPFDEGSLTGTLTAETTFPEGDFRADYFRGDRLQQVDERVGALLDDLGIEREQLAEVALRYILSQPAVSTVIPGMRSLRNVERNIAVADGRGLEPAQLERLHAHRWDRNFYA
jgi:aryl-alcohol dehydrogenase-like predicted oxidoreductase